MELGLSLFDQTFIGESNFCQSTKKACKSLHIVVASFAQLAKWYFGRVLAVYKASAKMFCSDSLASFSTTEKANYFVDFDTKYDSS